MTDSAQDKRAAPQPAPGAERRPSWQLGRLALGFFAVTVISGIALLPFYDPAAAGASLEGIYGGIPWAWLIRGVHWFAALGLWLTTAAHTGEVIARRLMDRLPRAQWYRSLALLPLVTAALLSGFVMQGNAEAAAALAIWRGLVESVPLAGPELARLLLGLEPGGLATISLHHVGTFTVLIWLLGAEHGRQLLPDGRALVLTAIVSAALAALIAVPLGPLEPPGDGRALLGPWYLLGLQGALRELPAAVGWAVPLGSLVLLAGLIHVKARGRRWLLAALVSLALVYAGLTVKVLLPGGL